MKRKVLSIILALALFMGLATPAFAATESELISITTINVPGAFELTATLKNAYDVCYGEVFPVEDDESGAWFFFGDESTVTFNKDVIIVIDTVFGISPDNENSNWYVLDAGQTIKPPFTLVYGRYKENPVLENKNVVFPNLRRDDVTWVSFGTRPLPRDSNWPKQTISIYDFVITTTPEQPSSWAAEQVNVAIEANLVPENLQSKYTQATTRAEFASLAVTLYETVIGNVIEIGDNPFTDTNDINAIKAAAIKVTTGTTETTFSPDANLTREQAATMLSRLANAMGKPLPQHASTFNDNASIAIYALEAVGQMQVTKIMGGVGDNTFSPKSPYTREQSIMTAWRLFEIVK